MPTLVNKNELEYHKARANAERFGHIIQLVSRLMLGLIVLAGIWVFFDGLAKVLTGQSPEGISAFAKVIEALELGSIIGYLWGAGASAAWYRERRGKQRIIQEKSRLQRQAEDGDPYRTTSGLTEIGGSPAREEA